MTAQFPTNIVNTGNIPNFNPLDTLSTDNHSGRSNDLRDEVIALETKVGANSSAVTTTHDYKLSLVTGTDKAAGLSSTSSLSNKTMVSPKVTVGSDAIGDMYYNSIGAVGTQVRLPVGSNGQVLTVAGGVPTYASPSSANANYIVDTGAANAYVATLVPAITSYTAGQLVQFKAINANTTTSTVNVNGLGVKTIMKLGGATNLASGDIAAGMVVQLEYDGTNFVMLNPVANAPLLPTGSAANLTGVMQAKNGTFTISASGTTTITTSFRPYQITLHATIGGATGGTIPATSHGGYDATSNTMWCTYTSFDTNGSVNGSGNSTTYSVNITYGTTGPAATTAVINNITATSFDIVRTFGAASPVVYWTAIGY